jgi:membrane associated rhomboid family serine protease
VVFLGVYALQAVDGQAALCTAGDPAAACARYAFAPAALDHGQLKGLVTALFMHGSWAHVGFNSVFAVAFGAPIARMFGARWSGALALLAFFLMCGVAGNLGYALIRPHAAVPVIGASGGVAGFMGAASRLLGRADPGPRGDLAPFWSRTVIGMAAAWITVNLIVGVLGVDIGFGAAGQPVAWEAHLFGYLAGLVLSGPALALARRLH